MKAVRDAVAGTACILLLVALGFWYADSRRGSLAAANQKSSHTTVTRVAWSGDGRALLSLSNSGVPRLSLDDAFGRGPRLELSDVEGAASAVLIPDARSALVGTWYGQLVRVDSQSTGTKCIFALPSAEMISIVRVAICPEGRTAAAAVSDGRILLCDSNGDRPPQVIPGSRSAATDLQFSRDARRLVIARANGRVGILNVADGHCECELPAHEGRAIAAAFLPGNRTLITAGEDEVIRIWDLTAARETWQARFEAGSFQAFDVSPDGRMAAWGGFNRKIVVWDLERQCTIFEIPIPTSAVFQVKFSPDGTWLAEAGTEGIIRLFDLRTGAEGAQIRVDGDQ